MFAKVVHNAWRKACKESNNSDDACIATCFECNSTDELDDIGCDIPNQSKQTNNVNIFPEHSCSQAQTARPSQYLTSCTSTAMSGAPSSSASGQYSAAGGQLPGSPSSSAAKYGKQVGYAGTAMPRPAFQRLDRPSPMFVPRLLLKAALRKRVKAMKSARERPRERDL